MCLWGTAGSSSVFGARVYLPLHHACIGGAPLNVVRYLVHEYPESLHVNDIYGHLPLHHVCDSGAPLEVVRYLVEAYRESLQVTSCSGKKPIDLANKHEFVAWLESAMAEFV